MPLNRYYTLSNLFTLINLLVLSVVVYCGVDVFYTLAGATLTEIDIKRVAAERTNKSLTMAKRQTFGHYAPAIDRGLFGLADETDTKIPDISVDDLEPTALNVALLGTVSGDEKTARAIIQDKAKKSQSLFKEGDTIQNAQIMKILRGKVILKVGEKNQVLIMEEQSTASASSRRKPSTRRRSASQSQESTNITLDRATVNKSLENITELLSQVRVRPHYKDGKADGLMISQVRPNTIFTRLGLRNGDIIQNIDGEAIEDPDDILDFYEELKSGSSVSLGIQRRGKKKVVNYGFK